MNISNSRFRNSSAAVQQTLVSSITTNLQSFGKLFFSLNFSFLLNIGIIAVILLIGRGRGFTSAAVQEPLPHERRRYVERTRTSMPVSTTGPTIDLTNQRFNFSALPSASIPSQNTSTNNEVSQQTPKLPVSRNQTTGSFNKQTIK